MNPNLIYLQEQIQHDKFIVYLYILKLPIDIKEQEQIEEIIRKKQINIIFNLGNQSLNFQNVRVNPITQNISSQEIIQQIQDELINQKHNIGLMCSINYEKSLDVYFQYMVGMQQKDLKFFQDHYQFNNLYSKQELKQKYDQIKNPQNITIFNYDLLQTKSNIGSQISSLVCQSENMSKQQQITEQIPNDQFLGDLKTYTSQRQPSQIDNQNYSNLLSREDQVISEIIPLQKYNCNSDTINEDQNNPNNNQHELKFDDEKYKLPSIQFIQYFCTSSLKCLE